jgi:hypothetical protein
VAWLLAKRKSDDRGFGHKVIQSITLFHADLFPELNGEEVLRFYTPVLLFEIVDVSDEVRDTHRTLEMGWTSLPDSAFHSWYSEW